MALYFKIMSNKVHSRREKVKTDVNQIKKTPGNRPEY